MPFGDLPEGKDTILVTDWQHWTQALVSYSPTEAPLEKAMTFSYSDQREKSDTEERAAFEGWRRIHFYLFSQTVWKGI